MDFENNNNDGRQSFYLAEEHQPDYRENKNRYLRFSRSGFLLLVAAIVIVSTVLGGAIWQYTSPLISSSSNSALDTSTPTPTPAVTPTNTAASNTAADNQPGRELTAAEIVQKVKPSVVGIVCTVTQNYQTGENIGTGIIMSEDGYILTNAHVIEGATKISVVLDNQENYTARVIGSDQQADIAVIQINTKGKKLPAAEFGDSDKLVAGDPVVAIGTPYGIEFAGSATSGIVSAINRDVMVDDGSRVMTLIQTDATINPGNSGGPLINKYGQVIGINSVKFGMGYFEGLGFAIPVNTALPITQDLIKYGYVKGRPMLGLSGSDVSAIDSELYGIPVGVEIQVVTPDGPAAKAGLRRGDIIVKFQDVKITKIAELLRERDKYKAGDTVSITVNRNGQEMTVTLTLEENVPDTARRG